MTRVHHRITHKTWALDSPKGYDWLDYAACSPDTAEWFWPVVNGPLRLSDDNYRALALCASCPVLAKSKCLEWQMKFPSPDVRIAAGRIWGLSRTPQPVTPENMASALPPRSCRTCNRTFRAGSNAHAYCSDACMQQMKRARRMRRVAERQACA